MTPSANTITAELLIRIPKEFPGARVWRQNRLSAMAVGRGGKLRHVSAGINGQGDITGIMPMSHRPDYYGIAVHGIRIEIEIKTPRDRQSQAQKDFQKMITDAGGIYIVARSVEQCIKELEGWV